MLNEFEIVRKTNLILKIILILFAIIFFKNWHLTVIERKTKIIESQKPKKRVILQKANRGEVFDRYGNPIAINRTKYNATIYYSHIKHIPRIKFYFENGKKIKKYERREYIKKLSSFLAKELKLDSERIEDLIDSKASLMPHIPFIIKESISEKEYYRLKILEKDFPGIYAERTSERHYPLKKNLSEIVGFMGAINHEEYLNIAKETEKLNKMVIAYQNNEDIDFENYKEIEDVEKRLNQLNSLSYGINDLIGKSGIEKKFEENLKGFHQKKTFLVDIQGNFLKELEPKIKPKAGKSLKLSIISDLQKFCENILQEEEFYRDGLSKAYNKKKKCRESLKQPFFKGGSIVVMDPNTSDVYALATYPTFDPNDFIPSSNQNIKEIKQKNISKWLETYVHIGNIFDGKDLLLRERNEINFEKKELTFENYLEMILSEESNIIQGLNKIQNLSNAIKLQEDIENLIFHTKALPIDIMNHIFLQNNKNYKLDESLLLNLEKQDLKESKNRIVNFLSNISDNRDKLFTLDILRLFVYSPAFSDALIEKTKHISISKYYEISKSAHRIRDILKKEIKNLFSENNFLNWKEKNFKNYILEKRKIEKEKKIFSKPYIDYLNEKENELFNEFWDKNKNILLCALFFQPISFEEDFSKYFDFIKSINTTIFENDFEFLKNELNFLKFEDSISFIKTTRTFNELDRKLLYNYPRIRTSKEGKLEKHLAAAFYPRNGFGYTKSCAINNSFPIGSLFKLIPAYTALKERYFYLKENNLNLNNLNPLTMIDTVYFDYKIKNGSLIVGKTLDNKPYPRIYKKGRLPKSTHFDNGKISMIEALECSSNPYFSILSTDCISTPYSLIYESKNFNLGSKTGIDLPNENKGNLPEDILFDRTSLYSFAIGQHSLVVTPIQAAVMLSAIANKGIVYKPKLLLDVKAEIINKIFMPDKIRTILLEGMDKVVCGEKGSARASIQKKLRQNKDLRNKYIENHHKFVGKTSTAEFMYHLNMNPSAKAEKYKNIWFGAISFKDNNYNTKKELWDNPELVVVVQLNFGSSGKDASSLAFQIIEKYRELVKEYF